MVWATLNPTHNTALKELIEGQNSDRIVAIVGGALVEDALRIALEYRLRQKQGTTDINELLFKPGGPLGNFIPKIQIAYQLYMFEKPYRNAMTGIAEIRNSFAHHLDMNFESPSEKTIAAFKKLELENTVSFYPNPHDGLPLGALDAITNKRDKFLVNLKLCLLHLSGDFGKHIPHTNLPIHAGHKP